MASTVTVVVLEITNATDEQIQSDLGQSFHDFCNNNKGAGITASVLKDKAAIKVVSYINEEEK